MVHEVGPHDDRDGVNLVIGGASTDSGWARIVVQLYIGGEGQRRWGDSPVPAFHIFRVFINVPLGTSGGKK